MSTTMLQIGALGTIALATSRPESSRVDEMDAADHAAALRLANTIAPPPSRPPGTFVAPAPPGLSDADYAEAVLAGGAAEPSEFDYGTDAEFDHTPPQSPFVLPLSPACGYCCVAIPVGPDGSLQALPPLGSLIYTLTSWQPLMPFDFLPPQQLPGAMESQDAAPAQMRADTSSQPRRSKAKQSLAQLQHRATAPWVPNIQRAHQQAALALEQLEDDVPAPEDEQTFCVICQEGSERNKQYVRLTNCSHNFHESCWCKLQKSGATAVKQRCPTCKQAHDDKTEPWSWATKSKKKNKAKKN